jgi:hypothetical protein
LKISGVAICDEEEETMINLGFFPPKVATNVVKNELAALGIPAQTAFPSSSRDVFSFTYGLLQFASGQQMTFERHADAWIVRSTMSMTSGLVAAMILDAPGIVFEKFSGRLGPRLCLAHSLCDLRRFVKVCREEFGGELNQSISSVELCDAGLLRPCTDTDEAGFLEEPAAVESEIIIASWEGGPMISCLSRGSDLLAAVYVLGSFGGEHTPALNPQEAEELADVIMSAASLRRPCDNIENVKGYVPYHEYPFESQPLLLATRFPSWDAVLKGEADDGFIRRLKGWSSLVGPTVQPKGVLVGSSLGPTQADSCVVARLIPPVARCA